MKKLIIPLMLILVTAGLIQAQAPWSVNPAGYEFSMNVTGRVKIDHSFAEQPGSWMGVFKEEECRGVVKASKVGTEHYYYYLTLYSNAASGEMLTFKFSDENGTVHSFDRQLLFVADAVYGTPDSPYLWCSPSEFSSTAFLEFSVEQQEDTSTIDTTNKTIEATVAAEIDWNTLKVWFEVPAGAKVYVDEELQESGKNTHDFSQPLTYTVHGSDGKITEWTAMVGYPLATGSFFKEETSIYPNPAGDYFIISNAGIERNNRMTTIELCNINGQILKRKTFRSGEQQLLINNFDLPAGLYLVKITNGPEQRVFKLVKK